MTDSYIMFRASGQSLAVVSTAVGAIYDDLTVQTVGDTQKWFLGLAVADGVLVPVTDLGRYLQLGKTSGRTLCINPELGVGALRVDEVMGVDDQVTRLDQAELPQALRANAELFSHALSAGTGCHWVIDIPQLLQAERFVNIGEPA